MLSTIKMRCSLVRSSVVLSTVLCLLPTAFAGGYRQANLISDIPGQAKFTDSNVVNPWGIVVDGDLLVVADNGTGLISIYEIGHFGDSRVIAIPPAGGASPTGIVRNDTSDFVITGCSNSEPATYLVATEDGTIAGWNESVDRAVAIQVVDNSASDSIYKGLAIGSNAAGNFLFATDFHNNKVDVFDRNFNLVDSFTDAFMPDGYAPFGIHNIDGILYVTFALQDGAAEDDVPGAGNGFVDTFDTSGNLILHFASQGSLNSPWGVTLAPDDFGGLSNAILVGNFGDGQISAFDRTDGNFLGRLRNKKKVPMSIDGLWGIVFAPSGDGPDTLLFAAGINDEAHGLIGRVRPRGN